MIEENDPNYKIPDNVHLTEYKRAQKDLDFRLSKCVINRVFCMSVTSYADWIHSYELFFFSFWLLSTLDQQENTFKSMWLSLKGHATELSLRRMSYL